MKVRLLAKAVDDLDKIKSFIEADSPRAALDVARCFADSFGLIGNNPEIGRPIEGQAVRLFVVPRLPYVMPYRIRRNAIEILRVFHTSQRRPARWR